MCSLTQDSEGALFYLKESNLKCDLGNRKALGKGLLEHQPLQETPRASFVFYLMGGGSILDNSQVWQ